MKPLTQQSQRGTSCGSCSQQQHRTTSKHNNNNNTVSSWLLCVLVLLTITVVNELCKSYQSTNYFYHFAATVVDTTEDSNEDGEDRSSWLAHDGTSSRSSTKGSNNFILTTTTKASLKAHVVTTTQQTTTTSLPRLIPKNLQQHQQNEEEEEDGGDEGEEVLVPFVPVNEKQRRNLDYAYDSIEEMNERHVRFPSIQDRVKLYMSNWYLPPCSSTSSDDDEHHRGRIVYTYTPYNSTVQFVTLLETTTTTTSSSSSSSQQQRIFQINPFFIGSSVSGSFDQVHYMDRTAMSRQCKHRYCKDLMTFLVPALDRIYKNTNTLEEDSGDSGPPTIQPPPILYQFGDDNRTKAMRAPSTISFGGNDELQQEQQRRRYTKVSSLYRYSSRMTDRYPNIPVIKKIRKALLPAELDRITTPSTPAVREYGVKEEACLEERIVPNNYHLEPIVFKLKTQRHYGRIYDLALYDTVPWNQKINQAIFRGEMNGNYPVNYVDSGQLQHDSIQDRCKLLERCWIVYTHGHSTLVNAKITLPYNPNNSKQIPRYLYRRPNLSSNSKKDDEEDNETNQDDDPTPDNGRTLNHNHENEDDTNDDEGNDNNEAANDDDNDEKIDLYGDKVSMEDMLQYKALIMLEGNDVSSGLKWALFSNCVVMMPPPTLTSWAMEERLIPWVHYIPINVYACPDKGNETTIVGGEQQPQKIMTDVEEKMQWILDHDDEAQQIAKAGKLWIADLVLHPDVVQEEQGIFDEMIVRYAAHFVQSSQFYETTTTNSRR